MKNMRAKLRQRVSFKDENNNKQDQEEFSFKSNNQNLENKISELKLENSKRDNSVLYEEENLRIQNETKDLIRKTKKMMENLDLVKLKTGIKTGSKSVSKEKAHNSNNLSMSFDNKMKRSFNEEMYYSNEAKKKTDFYSSQRNYNLTNYSQHALNLNSNSNYLNNSHSNNLSNEILLKNHKGISIEHMTQELVENKKKIQKLEKELKDKNNLIKKLNEKIDLKNNEITSLNEIINVR